MILGLAPRIAADTPVSRRASYETLRTAS